MMSSICSVEECDNKHHALKLCEKHYRRLKNTGTTKIRIRSREDRCWEQVHQCDNCWTWVASTDKEGYGNFKVKRKRCRAHIVSWEIHKGRIPAGMCVLHKCDNPPCIRPEHLFLGSVKDNSADMVTKGRSTKGTRNPHAKLTEADVRNIRKRYATTSITQRELSAEYGVVQQQISHIVNHKKWNI